MGPPSDVDDAGIESLVVAVTEGDEMIEKEMSQERDGCTWSNWQRYVCGPRRVRQTPVAHGEVLRGAESWRRESVFGAADGDRVLAGTEVDLPDEDYPPLR